jgi:uncharacterized phage-associated protein
MTMENLNCNRAKSAQLIAYVASKTDVGKTKLMKLLYFIDFTAYAKLGRPITNDSYVNRRWGPVPSDIFHNLESLIGGYANMSLESRGGENPYAKYSPVDGNSSLHGFADEEIAIIDEVLSLYGNKTRSQLVNVTHEEIPWQVTTEGEPIPYFLAPYRAYKRPTKSDVKAITSNKKLMATIDRAFATYQQELKAESVSF